jgi:hypothetical protein
MIHREVYLSLNISVLWWTVVHDCQLRSKGHIKAWEQRGPPDSIRISDAVLGKAVRCW